MTLLEIFQLPEFVQAVQTGGIGLVILLTLVQISPIEFNPWSALAKMVGKALNQE